MAKTSTSERLSRTISSVVDKEARHFGLVTSPDGFTTRPEVSDHPALLVELRRRSAAS